MQVLAYKVKKSSTPVIVCAIIIMLLFGIFAIFFFGDRGPLLGIFSILMAPVLCVRYYSYTKNFNSDDTPPVWTNGERFFCSNGKEKISFPCDALNYAEGKNAMYFRYFVFFISWGSCDYGKLTLHYNDEAGVEQKFVISYVADPKAAAENIENYRDYEFSADTDYTNDSDDAEDTEDTED